MLLIYASLQTQADRILVYQITIFHDEDKWCQTRSPDKVY